MIMHYNKIIELLEEMVDIIAQLRISKQIKISQIDNLKFKITMRGIELC